MTKRSDLKELVRARQEKTGEKYMAALRNIRRNAQTPPVPPLTPPPVDPPMAAPPAAPEPRRIHLNEVFNHFPPKDHTYVVPKGDKEFGPFSDLRQVADARLEKVLATGKWRTLTDEEDRDAADAQFSWPAFEDYSGEQDWDF